jgi:hypothetical protein
MGKLVCGTPAEGFYLPTKNTYGLTDPMKPFNKEEAVTERQCYSTFRKYLPRPSMHAFTLFLVSDAKSDENFSHV